MRCDRRTAQVIKSGAVLALLAFTTAGCQTSGGGLLGQVQSFSPSSLVSSSAPAAADPQRELAAAGEKYRSDPGTAAAALRYAQALRQNGQRAQASAVLQQASIRHPRDRAILGTYGRALAEAGQLAEAHEMLSRAHSPDQPDWRILSAQGAVLDQMGRHEEARRYYTTALKIVPEEPSVLSNLGMSYILAKELPEAERTLRRANTAGATDRRVKQNLALAIGLQGRSKEAEEIMRDTLPPAQASENVAYLRDMVARTRVASAKPKASKTRVAKKQPPVESDPIPLQHADLGDKD